VTKIEHVAIWTSDLERLRGFYERYFGARAGDKYVNEEREFESYFLTFADGARLELMRSPEVPDSTGRPADPAWGYAHLAFSVGSEEAVAALTARLRVDGYTVRGPRRTGDGYYESVAFDPDGNRVEITV
jgi:lactoylglutathione lyase